MMPPQRQSRKIRLHNVEIGGGAPVTVQSMTNTPTSDPDRTLTQIRSLAALGCDIIRVSVDNSKDIEALKVITRESPIPVVADIQFDAATAIGALESGAAAVRLNPGLVRDKRQLEPVAKAILDHDAAVRVGVNSGSVGTDALRSAMAKGLDHHAAAVQVLVEAALRQCEQLESFGVRNIKAALKSTSVQTTFDACKAFAAQTDYPLHLGITEAGTRERGIIKSACGIGAMLLSGIGDTLRVSLTAPPEEEVIAGIRILESCGLRKNAVEIISCPTCGRTAIDLPELVSRVELLVQEIRQSGKTPAMKKIAVMGCPVNGPGEARDADIGIAGSKDGKQLVVFCRGKVAGAFDVENGFEYFKNELLKSCR